MANFPDYRDDTLERPQVRGETPLGWPADEGGLQPLQRCSVEAGLPASAARPAQAGRAMRPPRFVPSAGGLPGHTQPVNDIGLTLTTGEQLRRTLAARFQSSEISSGTKDVRHEGIVAGPLANVTILRKDH